MKKRIVCVLLTLIMLVGLLPMTVSAASGISESAVTVLKQLEGYITKCNTKGYTGYGTLCTEEGAHGNHTTNEKLADAALRKALAELDSAVNSFAANNGLSLTQGQHDALVLFSFENGTAWTTGTGDFKAAVTSRKTGSDFLDAICRWDANTNDDNRRMIEANMYLNGVYSSSRPSTFIRVVYDPTEGKLHQNSEIQYYDVSEKPVPHLTPYRDGYSFTGWYVEGTTGTTRVTTLTSSHHGKTLIAKWTSGSGKPGDNTVDYALSEGQLLAQQVYRYSSLTKKFTAVSKKYASSYFKNGVLKIDSDYVDKDGIRWCRIDNTSYWVMASGIVGTDNTGSIDVTVTVTNSYVRSRANATIFSSQNGSFSQGDTLRIIRTEEADGFLWGQVAKSATDSTPIGWIALMYTNFESVRSESSTAGNTNVIATAIITYNGYVNVRSDAGTNNKIVGALPKGAEVGLYETKFINGIEWGRCSTGWICLTYANVLRHITDNSYLNDEGFTTYAFSGKVDTATVKVYKNPRSTADLVKLDKDFSSKVTVSNFVLKEGITWGKIKEGWVKVSDAEGNSLDVNLDTAKFYVAADTLTVRSAPNTAAERVDVLLKGVEFNINESYQILVYGDTIWGYATKVGENNRTYKGWVNLATANITRSDVPPVSAESGTTAVTGLLGTVINTDALRVRSTGATYGTQIATLSRGTTVAIWEANEDETWYKVDSNQDGVYNYEEDGWVSAAYLEVYEGTVSGGDSGSTGGTGTGSGSVETGMGVVANTYSGVNIRQGAGTAYAAVGKFLPGTAVEILEVKTVGATKWGRTAQGWVSMDYIAMVSNYPITGGGTGTGSGSSTTTSEVAIYTGKAKVGLTVYKETSLNSDAVRMLDAGDPITMHELLTVVEYEDKNIGSSEDNTGSTTTTEKKTTYWARINDGYIYAPGDSITLDTVDEHTYTVTGSDKLNVRSAAGTNNDILFELKKGDQVTVTQLTIVNSSVWGKIECEDEKGHLITGWASLAYMSKGAITIQDNTQNNNQNNNNTGNSGSVGMGNGSSTGGFVTNTSGYRYTGTVIRANEVNVRATPSTAASKTTTLKNGQALVIYETTTAENMAWGRCDAGWVYLYYVDLVPVTGAVDARVVYNDNTVIYSDMNGSAVAGTYARMSVIDIFEIVGKMARTELGWVNTDNLL